MYLNQIMKTKTKDLMKMNEAQILFVRDYLQSLQQKVSLATKAIENIKELKEKSHVH